MEIVLAVLLFFGGFTLGSVTADKNEDDVSNGDGVPDSHLATRVMPQSDPTRCHSSGVVIYRDLTVPYNGQIERPAIEISDCEGECPNE